MNTPTPSITETDLHAWLDGELTAERRAEVDSWLQGHPEDAARVRLWAADREVLRVQFEAVLAEPVPARLRALVTGRGGRALHQPIWRMAAAVLLFGLGGLVGAALMWRSQAGAVASALVAASAGPAAPGAWAQRAVVAHTVYVPEVRHAVEVRAQEEHLSRWLTRRIQAPVKLFDLRAQGFELVGGRLLPDAAGPSAQLMYEAIEKPVSAPGAASGAVPPKPTRVTVYLRKPDDTTPAEFRYEQRGELGMFYWVEGRSAHGKPCGYALVGALPRAQLLALAEAIYKQDGGTP
jgi:anti-sigma factor RsiW